MKNTSNNILRCAATAALLAITACGSSTPDKTIDASSSGSDGGSAGTTFTQVEHLARPGINEALLISNDFLNGYNATAPSFAGVDPTTLGKVVGEAKTVLKAIYLGTCLLDGTVPGLTPATGLKPAGMQCVEIGTAIFTENSLAGTHVTAASAAAAQAYADTVFAQFEPDVMRVDTGLATSGYLNACGAGSGSAIAPLLCGGRFVDDDVIDVTYYYLLGGLNPAVTLGSAATYNQFSALVSDGVQYYSDNSKNKFNTTPSVPGNPNQFHPDPSQAYPYSAAPF